MVAVESAVATSTATVHAINPSIALSKTVGTEAGVCATTDTIEVEAGTVVYYCYTVTNTGNVTLSFHDLEDDVLGTILMAMPMTWHREQVWTRWRLVSISDTIAATTVNTAVWTAYNDAEVSASASATATVTVSNYYLYLPVILKP
ncbi:MAG: hypothetical protein R3E31_06700 [Chloroflexota bacterium]